MAPGQKAEETVAAAFLREVSRHVDPSTYRLWLGSLEVVGVSGNRLALAVPPRNRAWVQQRFGTLLSRCAQRASDGALTGVVFAAPPGAEEVVEDLAVPIPTRQTFATFAVGHANRLAHNAALTVAEVPAGSFNPLYLCGPAGCGKSHLLAAIAAALREHHPDLTVLYTTAERFSAAFLAALRGRRLGPFKGRTRGVDVLLLDSLEFVCGKDRTEEELYHALAAVGERGGQVVLAARSRPQDLPFSSEQLRGLCASGLVADLQPPDRGLRLTLLRRHAAAQGLDVEDGALELIAARGSQSVRELLAAFLRVVAYASLRGEPVTAALAERALDAFYPPAPGGPLSIEVVKRAVAERFGLSPQQLEGKGRSQKVAAARRLAVYLARELCGFSLPTLGRAFGGRDHTTILAAIRSCEGELRESPQLRLLAGEIAASLGKDLKLSPAQSTGGSATDKKPRGRARGPIHNNPHANYS
jgi:chromosomal replication initiator protein